MKHEEGFLFGVGSGAATHGEFRCDLCGHVYFEGADDDEDYDNDGVSYEQFCAWDICENCFGKIERDILRRMPDILKWYKKLLISKSGQ